jgi:hypothetical protein
MASFSKGKPSKRWEKLKEICPAAFSTPGSLFLHDTCSIKVALTIIEANKAYFFFMFY